MTETEWALLVLGAEIGSLITLLVHVIVSTIEDRRALKAARAAQAQLDAAREKARA